MPKLPQWIQQLSGSEESIEPLLVPGNWFVTRAFAVPEELKAKEIEEFAELSVEEISPFNLEQLNWGYYYNEISSRIFIYAAYDHKLKACMADSELYDYVFPDFAQTLGLKFEQPTLIFLLHEATLNGILLPENDSVPQTVVGISLEAEFTSEDLEVAKVQITQRIRDQVNRLPETTLANPVADFDTVVIGEPVYTRDWDYKEPKANASIGLKPYGGAEGPLWQVLIPVSSRLWELDIRKSDAKEQLVKKHGWTLWYWRASVLVILLFFLLAFAEIGLMGLSKWNAKELAIALRDQPKAEKVEQRADILQKIVDITTNQLLPFEMLDAVNQLRPESIYFTRFTAESGNALQVEAVSSQTTAVNDFKESLEELSYLSSVEISNSRVQNNRTTFRLRVVFENGALEPQTFLTEL